MPIANDRQRDHADALHKEVDEEADGVWSICFSDILRAKLDERDYIIRA